MTDNRQPSGWRKRALLFLTSQCITLFGSTLVQMALVWYAAMETASGGWVAAFSVCSYLPQFLVSFLGGVWADRYNRKALIIGADVLIACATLAMIPALPHIPSARPCWAACWVMSLSVPWGRHPGPGGERGHSPAGPGGPAHAVQRPQCRHAVAGEFRRPGGGRRGIRGE